MSLILNSGTEPEGLDVRTYIPGGSVRFGDYDVSIQDFLKAVKYVLTNTDLAPDDPRQKFVEYVQSMREVEGHNKSLKRLESTELR